MQLRQAVATSSTGMIYAGTGVCPFVQNVPFCASRKKSPQCWMICLAKMTSARILRQVTNRAEIILPV